MKIICVEEHSVDVVLGQAAQPAIRAEAGFMKDWGSRITDTPRELTRPHQVSLAIALERALDLDGGRLAQMDEHGIAMQVLSYSTVAQLAPAATAPDLCRVANDRLAKAVAGSPTRFAAFALLPWQVPDLAARELERAVSGITKLASRLCE